LSLWKIPERRNEIPARKEVAIMRFKRRKEEDLMLSIVPLIDTIFFLMLFFAVTYDFDLASGIHIDMPEVAQKSIEDEANKVTLIMNKSGEIYLNGEKIDKKNLEKRLQALVKEKGILSVILQADKDVSHGKVVQIMDLAKNAGINSVIIAARWKSEELQ
jgi:biopolymer transport protein ExbD